MIRIGYARIFQETCPFSPLKTTRQTFLDSHFVTGDALVRSCRLTGNEVPGMLRNAELSGFVQATHEHNLKARLTREPLLEPVPLMSAGVVPCGALTPETFRWLREELTERLKGAGSLDGLYLCLHGSMQVDDLMDSPEAILLKDARRVLGRQIPLAISLDLHALVTPELVAEADILCSYQTVPHRDFFFVGRRTGQLLLDTVLGKIRPVTAWRKLPVAYGGGLMMDFLKPLSPIFRRMRQMEKKRGALRVGFCMAHPFTKARDIGWALLVTTDNDPAAADAMAEELADMAWEAAKVPVPAFLSAEEAIGEARRARWARRTGVVSIVDTGDVVSAGASGGSTELLAFLVAKPLDLNVYLAVHDPEAVTTLAAAHPGQIAEVLVRGTPGLADNPEVPCRGTLLGCYQTTVSGKAVVLDLHPVKLILTEKPPMTIFPRFFKEVGLSPWKADVVVQKAFFHYRWFFGLVNRKNIGMMSRGATDLRNLRDIPRSVPLIPFHGPDSWRPYDPILRGIAPQPG